MLRVVGAGGRRLACGVLLAVCVLAPVASQVSRDGWVQAQSDRALEFPRDHWSHPDYRIEWWYYTGNLEGERGQRFGYQLTFSEWVLIACPPIRPHGLFGICIWHIWP